ncbi:MAG: hypothetical protein EP347_09945 [Alphaproteobacteria bacterium]|nr:MAG: hypothetical protein EP347_09945 [Alphaproteobacteria bacterium]
MFDENAQEQSSWGTMLRVLAILLVLSGGLLYYYFGPSYDDIQGNTPEFSFSTVPVDLSVGGMRFVIPENYTQFPRDRRGGVRENVALYAILPTMQPYTRDLASHFEDSSEESPIVHLQIESYRAPFNEEERFERIYRPKFISQDGAPGPDGLTAYKFREGTGYHGEDLYVGKDDLGRMIILRCSPFDSELLFPNCRRDTQLSPTVGLSYRFKRSRLANWRQIDDDVRTLVWSFLSDDQTPVSD